MRRTQRDAGDIAGASCASLDTQGVRHCGSHGDGFHAAARQGACSMHSSSAVPNDGSAGVRDL
jgi:hypothetical protein